MILLRTGKMLEGVQGSEINVVSTNYIVNIYESNILLIQMRERAWFQSSPNSRLQFVGPSPGFPCPEGGPNDSTTPQLDPAQGPVENFCLVTLEPQEVLCFSYSAL